MQKLADNLIEGKDKENLISIALFTMLIEDHKISEKLIEKPEEIEEKKTPIRVDDKDEEEYIRIGKNRFYANELNMAKKLLGQFNQIIVDEEDDHEKYTNLKEGLEFYDPEDSGEMTKEKFR